MSRKDDEVVALDADPHADGGTGVGGRNGDEGGRFIEDGGRFCGDGPLVEEGLLVKVLAAYDLGADPAVRLLEVSENATYRLDDHAAGRAWALRMYRPGYHTRAEILAELAWVSALRAEGVVATPSVVPARSGDLVVSAVAPGGGRRHAVIFEWVDGVSPELSDTAGLVRAFRALGEITARLHAHARRWCRPAGFTRFAWTWHTMLGSAGRWGRWADGVRAALAGQAGADGAVVLGRAAAEIERRLAGYGCGPDRFGLVHADLRLANLLVPDDPADPTSAADPTDSADPAGPARPGGVHVIDFDDCGFSWYLYDLAASLSFIEHAPAVGDFVEAWLAGYRALAPVTAADEAMIPTFVLLRRILLVAWLGTHPHSTAVASTADYATASCALADDYLAGRLLHQ